MRLKWSVVVMSMMLAAPTWISADLHNRGSGLIYDDVLDVTWLQDTNLAASKKFGVAGIQPGGQMTWDKTQEWVAAMNAANYKGVNTWRLPETVQPDPNCTSQDVQGDLDGNCILSELPHLHTVTLANPYEPTTGCTLPTCMPNVGPFENIENDIFYWSGTEWANDPDEAWLFAPYCGGQCHAVKRVETLAWPLFDGDVIGDHAVAVPTAPLWALIVLALLLLGAAWWASCWSALPSTRGPGSRRTSAR